MFTTVEKSEGTKEFLISWSPAQYTVHHHLAVPDLTADCIVLISDVPVRLISWDERETVVVGAVELPDTCHGNPIRPSDCSILGRPSVISLPSGYLIKKGLCLISVDWAHSNICTSDNWRAGHSGASHGAWHQVITLLAFNFPSLSKAKLHLSLAASAAVKGNQSSAEWEQCSGTVTMVGRYISHISYTPTPTPTVQWPSNVTYISWSVIFQWKYSNNQK